MPASREALILSARALSQATGSNPSPSAAASPPVGRNAVAVPPPAGSPAAGTGCSLSLTSSTAIRSGATRTVPSCPSIWTSTHGRPLDVRNTLCTVPSWVCPPPTSTRTRDWNQRVSSHRSPRSAAASQGWAGAASAAPPSRATGKDFFTVDSPASPTNGRTTNGRTTNSPGSLALCEAAKSAARPPSTTRPRAMSVPLPGSGV